MNKTNAGNNNNRIVVPNELCCRVSPFSYLREIICYLLLLQFTLLPTRSLSILKKTKQTKITTKRKKKQKQKQTNKQTNKQKTRRPINENKSSPDNK
jgi:hypothetical protein